MGARNLSAAPVAVDVVFERFPASIRGAVVVRGTDPNPHQVAVRSAYLVEAGSEGAAASPVELDLATVDLAPRAEVFIPFEVPVTSVGSGWYGVVAEVTVDGGLLLRSEVPGKLFPVAWPTGSTRRGQLAVGEDIEVPGISLRVERIDLRTDRAIVRWTCSPAGAEPPVEEVLVLADGVRLPVIEHGGREADRTTTVYPVLREHRTLTLRVERARGADGSVQQGPWDLEVALG